MKQKKIISIIFLVIVIINFILFIFNKSNWKTFWLVSVLCAGVAYLALPRIKE